jgi:hypothetical protein
MHSTYGYSPHADNGSGDPFTSTIEEEANWSSDQSRKPFIAHKIARDDTMKRDRAIESNGKAAA